jgi:hypothetical protein
MRLMAMEKGMTVWSTVEGKLLLWLGLLGLLSLPTSPLPGLEQRRALQKTVPELAKLARLCKM